MRHNAKETVAVAVSGGVDSLCAMLLLKQAGYKLIALHALLKSTDSAKSCETQNLETICGSLGMPLHVIDLRAAFAEKVVTPFARDYAAGETPNPCTVCNRLIKFGLLADAAFKLGAARFATGHYARLVPNPYENGVLLACAYDQKKDQSYFLARISNTIIPRLLFPCGCMLKTEIRNRVLVAGFEPPVRKESQDVCFSGQNWQSMVQDWIREDAPACQPGDVLLKQQDGSVTKVGRHSGLWKYTNGQRRGLGFPGPSAWHVLEKRLPARELVIGPKHMLGMRSLKAYNPVVFVPPNLWPQNIFVRTRLSQKMQLARVEFVKGSIIALFPEPVFPSASGQTLAVYDGEGRLLAGAVIREIISS